MTKPASAMSLDPRSSNPSVRTDRTTTSEARLGRPLHHHGYVHRPFGRICDDLETDGPAIVDVATRAAVSFAEDLADYLEDRLGYFDREEPVSVALGEIDRAPHEAMIPIEWHADHTRRLLPNVSAAIHLAPIISKGPGATTEITLRGAFAPKSAHHRGPVERALVRRVVDATLHTFLRHLVEELEHPTITPRQ